MDTRKGFAFVGLIVVLGVLLVTTIGWRYYEVHKALEPASTTTTDDGSDNWIKIGDSFMVGDVTLGPKAVTDDSRCPKDVTCVWAGTVRVQIEVEIAGSASQVVVLELAKAARVGAYDITPTQVMPEKLTIDNITAGDYRLSFEVEEVGGTPTPIPSATGSLHGKVSVGPLCPVEPCGSGQPRDIYKGVMLVATNSAKTYTVALASDGSYSIALVVAGEYKVTLEPCGWMGCRYTLPKVVNVGVNQDTELNIDIDTGIR